MSIEAVLSVLTLASFVVDMAIRVVRMVADHWAQRPRAVGL